MTDEAALLRGIRAARDDDTPRMVYADWLDEHGDPARAEFIRVQCWLSANDPYHPNAKVARRREKALARKHRDKWDAPLTRYINHYGTGYDRGFPTWFSVDEPADFAGVLSHLLMTTATDRLRVGVSTGESISPLLSDPAFVSIRELQVSADGPAFGDDAVDGLVRSDHVQQLVRLDISGRYALNRSPGVDVFVRTRLMPTLEHLHLAYTAASPQHKPLFDLICSPHRQQLRGLAFWSLDDRALFELAHLPELSRFTHLDLGHSFFSDAAAVRFTESHYLDRIELLTVPGLNRRAFTDIGRAALRTRFGHRVEFDLNIQRGRGAYEQHYYRTVTGRRA